MEVWRNSRSFILHFREERVFMYEEYGKFEKET